jgi:hypothetical protein
MYSSLIWELPALQVGLINLSIGLAISRVALFKSKQATPCQAIVAEKWMKGDTGTCNFIRDTW